MLQSKIIEYQINQKIFEGYYVFDDHKIGKRPVVLVFPDWSGRNEFACHKAEKLAQLGYVGFAVDMYGKGILGNTKEEKTALIKPLMENRSILIERVKEAFFVAKKIEQADPKHIGAIGFCFGGLCALDLARSGMDLNGVVSFHGLLTPLSNQEKSKIHAKILVLHGHDDPMVGIDQVIAFQNEMTDADVDWQLYTYGKTMHAFTNPQANDPKFGTVYNRLADHRSWITMQNFFNEIFNET